MGLGDLTQLESSVDHHSEAAVGDEVQHLGQFFGRAQRGTEDGAAAEVETVQVGSLRNRWWCRK